MILAATVPEPAGFAFLGQRIFADDYRDRTVAFRGDLRTTGLADRAGLVLRLGGGQSGPQPPAGQDPQHDPRQPLRPRRRDQ